MISLNLPRPPSSSVPRRVSPNFVDTLFPSSSRSQGNKTLAPGDAYRRDQKKKQLAKNKAARKEAREDALQKSDIGSLRAELKRLQAEKSMNREMARDKEQRMKQLENGIKWHEEQRKTNAGKTPAPAPAVPKVKGIGALKGLEVVVAGSTGSRGLGLGTFRPQDSVYYHPTLNPTGRPPAGKPQKYKAASEYHDEEEAGADEEDEYEYQELDLVVQGEGPLLPPPGAGEAAEEGSSRRSLSLENHTLLLGHKTNVRKSPSTLARSPAGPL